jgi:predicted ArsR family transcriptional regulator
MSEVLARRTDPLTSHEAASRVHEFSGNHHIRIMVALYHNPVGLTVHEIAVITSIDYHAVARRMPELQRMGMAVVAMQDGEEMTRPSPSGRMARVWRPA